MVLEKVNKPLYLLITFLCMVLPQVAYFLIARHCHYVDGIRDGLYDIIIAFLMWVDTFLISVTKLLDDALGDGGTECFAINGIICWILWTIGDVFDYIHLFQYLHA